MLHMCEPSQPMAKMIQVRNVPDGLHRELVRRAKARRQALTDYIQEVLEKEVSRPPVHELVDRIGRLPPVKLPLSAAELVRAERRARDRQLAKALRGSRTPRKPR